VIDVAVWLSLVPARVRIRELSLQPCNPRGVGTIPKGVDAYRLPIVVRDAEGVTKVEHEVLRTAATNVGTASLEYGRGPSRRVRTCDHQYG
jgi:hypothetical protein